MSQETPAPPKSGTLKIFDPSGVGELLRGWQLHVRRRREMHEVAARRLQAGSYFLGVPAVVFAAVAGSSALAAWQSESANTTLAIVGGAVGLAATILVSVQTFLDLGARAERHRLAAVAYKKLLRAFERTHPGDEDLRNVTDDSDLGRRLRQLQAELEEADSNAPVVAWRLAASIERRPVCVVDHAEQLVA